MPFTNKEVIILKPVLAFHKFLCLNFSEESVPELKKIQQNCTAYVIDKKQNDEETLDEIERHFVFMFRHEILKVMGKNLDTDVEATFLDFLCCFKFELHSQVVLLEDSLSDAKSFIRVKPRSFLFKWMKESVPQDSGFSAVLEHVNLSKLSEDATLIIRNFKNMTEVKRFLKQCYSIVFEAEMLRLADTSEQWPQISSYSEFCRYFSVDYYRELISLTED